jgi:glycosyltransferase involved in cell wall biosynthesis
VTVFLKRARVVVTLWAASADTLSEHFGVPRSRIVVIPNGCVGARFPLVTSPARARARNAIEIADDQRVAVYVGALSPEKAVDTAIDAIGRQPDWVLVVVGGGREEGALRALADSAAPGRVRFLPPLEDPASVLAAADVVVLPSRTEGMPAIAIEAGMSGLPIVASSVGGIPDTVVDGATGILVPPGEPDSFARAIEVAYANRAEMGPAARRHCLERFEMEVVTDAWAELLGSLS